MNSKAVTRIELKGDCIFYYNNPAGYVQKDKAIVDVIFQNEELTQWFRSKQLKVEWKEGVFERLSKGETILGVDETQLLLKSCRIWQLKADANQKMKFISYEKLLREFSKPRKEYYQCVYEGETETNDLELIYAKFSNSFPHGFTGHAISMSDVVELYDEGSSEYYYVDRFGFRFIDFNGTG